VLSKINATDYNTQWTTPAAGTVTAVTGTAPVVSSGGTTPAISMPAATGSVNGYLASIDWNTFNGKAPLASPVFTGNPTAPTPAAADNDTSIATTAFVTAAVAAAKTTADTDYVNVTGDTMSGALTVNSTITATGVIASSAAVNAVTYFTSTSTAAYLSCTGAGTVVLRPNGPLSSTGQMTVDNGGNAVIAGNLTTSGTLTVNTGLVNINGGYSATGATYGATFNTYWWRSSATGTGSTALYGFYNANGAVGSITVSASATTFATSSDERKKDFIGPYDPLKAIAIIRADPVRDFQWKTDGSYAIGWGAQTSYAVDPDLAVPPSEDDPEALWGVDQGRRTPYLWAALAWALDEIDDLKARVVALEAR
jgi:hypothetical protein